MFSMVFERIFGLKPSINIYTAGGARKAEMSVMLGPLEPEVDNPTVGKRTLDFTGFMDASEFAEIQASVSRMLHQGMRASF